MQAPVRGMTLGSEGYGSGASGRRGSREGQRVGGRRTRADKRERQRQRVWWFDMQRTEEREVGRRWRWFWGGELGRASGGRAGNEWAGISGCSGHLAGSVGLPGGGPWATRMGPCLPDAAVAGAACRQWGRALAWWRAVPRAVARSLRRSLKTTPLGLFYSTVQMFFFSQLSCPPRRGLLQPAAVCNEPRRASRLARLEPRLGRAVRSRMPNQGRIAASFLFLFLPALASSSGNEPRPVWRQISILGQELEQR